MAIATVIKILGWIFLLFPIVAYIGACSFIVYQIAKGDGLIMGFIMGGLTLFSLGAIMLIAAYFTDIFAFLA
jgi:hypothetical protein